MSDIVKFLMPDGTEVSNDPRWLAEQKMSLAEVAVQGTPNTGNVGILDALQQAQVGQGIAPGQSGQPGVGEKAVATEEEVARGVVSGKVIQPDDAANAGTPVSVENPDSNEAVRLAAEKLAEQEAEAAAALAKLADDGQDPGDPEKPYTEWTGKQLQAEVKVRNASRDDEDKISLTGVKNKGQLADLLTADDEAQADSATS